MTSITLDFSSTDAKAIPRTIKVLLPKGITMEFPIPVANIEKPKPKFKKGDKCGFDGYCTNKKCTFEHSSLESHKEAFKNGSPEEVHEHIDTLFNTLDEDQVKILIMIKSTKKGFHPFQRECNYNLDCKTKLCPFNHTKENEDFKDIKDAINSIEKMVYLKV